MANWNWSDRNDRYSNDPFYRSEGRRRERDIRSFDRDSGDYQRQDFTDRDQGQSYGGGYGSSMMGREREWPQRDFGGDFDRDRSRSDYGYGSSSDRDREGMRGYGSDYQSQGRQQGIASDYPSQMRYQGSAGFGSGSEYGQASSLSGTRHYIGKGPKGWKRSDERIVDDVCEILERNPMIDASNIEVAVKEGLVTLSGMVEDRRQKRLAEDLIESLSGVRDVHNELTVNKSLFEQAKDMLTGESATEGSASKKGSASRSAGSH